MDTGIVLVVGGARSGKSSFAQELVHHVNGRTVYIATAEPRDDEMEQRIAKHQKDRPKSWATVEAPLDLDKAIQSQGDTADVLLVDCLTLFVSNLLTDGLQTLGTEDNPQFAEETETRVRREVDKVVAAAQHVQALVVFVSNEVGQGLVPPYNLGRLYRDIAGWTNQAVARASDRVYWVQSGIAVELKQHAVTPDAAARVLCP